MRLDDIKFVINAHTNKVKEEASAVRMWDGKTPYYVHPIWCASTILHETSLPEDLRISGSQALLYHDVLEDTYASLPPDLSEKVKGFIYSMTFKTSEDEWKNLWQKDKEIRLLKIYDKTSNILDGSWMTPDRKNQHLDHLAKLIRDVKSNYGELNIVRIAKTLI